MISVSSFILTPIDFLNACVRASVFDISNEKISVDVRIVKGTSAPRLCAIPIAIAVFPVLQTGPNLKCQYSVMRISGEKNQSVPRRASHQNSSTCNLSFADHLQDNCGCFASL